MTKYLSIFLIAIFTSLALQAQTELPYKPYLISGLLKTPQVTKADNFILFQEDVPGYEIEHDVILTDLDKNIHYAITTDHKSTFCTTYPNSAVDASGDWVMYYSFRYNKNGIYLQNIWNGEIVTVTQNADPYFLCSWSPDGKKVLFVEDSGNITAPTLVIKIYNVDSGNVTDYQLTKNEEQTVVRGYSNPCWASDGNSIYYHTYLLSGGDYIFNFEFASKKLTKVMKGSFPFVSKVNGEVLYLENESIIGYDPKTASSRIVFNSYPVTKDENSFFMVGRKGGFLVAAAVVGKFSTGNDKKNLFIINLANLAVSEVKLKEKSAINFVKFNGDKIGYQVKGWITKGRSTGIYLENKLFTCDMDGSNSKIAMQAD